MVTIDEVLRRSEQGVLRPFLCVGDDGRRYFVKGRGAGRSSLTAEWICGNLGQKFGLPIPPFEIVKVPVQLIESSTVDGIAELGSGYAFASEQIPYVQELGAAHVKLVPNDLRRSILLFDWWIRNEDRAFGGTAGNPNLLWNNQTDRLAVIDHNAAFDPHFDAENFWGTHAFREERLAWKGDATFRIEQVERLERVMQHVPSIFESIPDAWLYEDDQETVKSDFDFETAKATLGAFRQDAFWTTLDL